MVHRAGYYQKADNQEIFYETYGNSHLPPLVLIHGFPFSGFMWAGNVEALSPFYFVVCIDLTGHGKSSISTGQYTMDTFVEDITGVCHFLGIHQAHFLGLSMGGYILLRLYELFPQLVKSLILCHTKPANDNRSAVLGRLSNIKLLEKGEIDTFQENFIKVLFADATYTEHPEKVSFIRDIIRFNEPKAIIGTLIALASRLDMTEMANAIKVPTLSIVGSEDKLINPLELKTLHDYLVDNHQNSNFVQMEGVGHLSNIESPDEFNNTVIRFLHSIG